jgi:hypothetical protein
MGSVLFLGICDNQSDYMPVGLTLFHVLRCRMHAFDVNCKQVVVVGTCMRTQLHGASYMGATQGIAARVHEGFCVCDAHKHGYQTQ